MVRSLKAEYDLDIDQMKQTSQLAKDLITKLLQPEPSLRPTASQCLAHGWFSTDGTNSNREIIMELETFWMKRCLARRRWYRALNTLKAMHIIRKLSSTEYKTGKNKHRLDTCIREDIMQEQNQEEQVLSFRI